MSMLMMVKAFSLKVGNPNRKLVLLKLADNANDQGECWPSYQHIADQCEISRRSAVAHITALCGMGLIEKKSRKSEKGSSSNLYKLTLGGESFAPPSANAAPPPSANAAPRTSHSLEPVNEPGSAGAENQPDPEKQRAARKRAMPDDFKPNETCRSKAIQLGINMEVELDKFTSFHQAKGNKYADWQAAFRNWLTKAAEFRAQRGGNVADIYEHRHTADVDIRRGPERGRPLPFGTSQPDDDGMITLPDGTCCHISEWDAGSVKWGDRA